MRLLLNTSFTIALTLLFTWIGPVFGQQCPPEENFSPCTCQVAGIDDVSGNYQYRLECLRVPMDEIRTIMERTTIDEFDQVSITVPSPDDVIPADLLANKRVIDIRLNCVARVYQLKVDQNAFRSTRNSTIYIGINTCDLSQLNWSFLNGFNILAQVTVGSSSNLHQTFSSLPELPDLKVLDFYSCSGGLNEWTEFPNLVRGLDAFYLWFSTQLSDEAMSRILNWILVSSSKTLQKLSIFANDLKSFPKEIQLFQGIGKLYIDNNMITTLKTEDLAFQSNNRVEQIDLSFNQIEVIEIRTFAGDFSEAEILLQGNRLVRFEADIFQSMLTQMSGSSGFLNIAFNPINCVEDPCHLAWLLRDNRNLLEKVRNGVCSNGIAVEELNADEFTNC